MPQITIKVDGQVVRKGLQDLSAEIPKVGRLQLYYSALRIRSRMAAPGAKPSYPINWVSIRQKKAFFATDGFGGGIPHRRTEAYQRGFEIVKLDNGYRLINNMPGAQYVGGNAYGQGQSQIHTGRWPFFRDIVDEETAHLAEDVQEQINIVARRMGF
jgi:hypothetical protein